MPVRLPTGPASSLRRLVLAALLALLPIGARAADHPEEARSLELRQRAPGRERLAWSARSPAPPAPAADPRLVGATLRSVGIDEEVTVSLPPPGWGIRGDGSLRFVNRLAPAGPSPVQRVALRVGRDLRLRAKATGIALDDPQQGSVSIFLTIGDDVYCSTCSAPKRDVPGRFEARLCPAPGSCSPGTTTTSTSLPASTTSTVTSTTATSTATSIPGTTSSSTTTTTLCSLVVQWGSLGSGPGQFNGPQGIATNADGTRVYVSDSNNHRVVVFDQDGAFVTALGSYGSADGAFIFPADVAVDSAGDLFVAEARRIQKFDPDGNFLTKWGRDGSADGEFTFVNGIGLDADGNVYVADLLANRIQVFDNAGGFLRKWGTSGPGVGEFEGASDVAVYDASDVYVTEQSGARRLSRFTLLGGIPDGVVSRSILQQANAVAADATGHVYLGVGSSVVRIDDPGLTGVEQTAWSGGFGGIVLGVATAPGNVVYATDLLQHFVQKRVCSP